MCLRNCSSCSLGSTAVYTPYGAGGRNVTNIFQSTLCKGPLPLLHLEPALVSVHCFLGSCTRQRAGLTELMVSQALQQTLALLQFALPREYLGQTGGKCVIWGEEACWLAKCQRFRSGNVLGFVLTLGKKGKKAKERKKCVCCLRSHSTNKYFSF